MNQSGGVHARYRNTVHNDVGLSPAKVPQLEPANPQAADKAD